MGDQQLLVSAAQICQALAVGASSPGQLLLTAVVRRPDVLQGGLQKCLQGCGCVACTTCVLRRGPGIVLQPEGILLTQLLELLLQLGILGLGLAELALAGRQHQGLCSQSLPNCSGLLSGSLQLLAQGCHTCFQCLPQGPVVLRCPLLFFLQL